MNWIHNPKHPFASYVIFAVTFVPSAFFAFLWKCLNSDFLPYLGEGADSNRAAVLAGGCFWLGSLWNRNWVEPKDSGDEYMKGQVKLVGWHLAAASIGIPAGRIIFSILPPWNEAIGAILGASFGSSIVAWIFRPQANRFVHDRGSVMINLEEAKRQIKALLISAEPRFKWAGQDLPGDVAEGNLIVAGAVGTGKTRMHRETLSSIVPTIYPGSDRRALIYDVKCDLLSELSTMNPQAPIVIFNPWDKRSVAWDMALDIKTPTDSKAFAQGLIIPGQHMFFTNAARNIVAGVVDSLNRTHPGNWDLRRLILLTATREMLGRVLAKTTLPTRYFKPDDTFANIHNEISNVMVPLETVAALWKHTDKMISLKKWALEGDSILVLAGKEDLRASLEIINRVAVKMVSTTFLSQRESPKRARLWFFCDELKIAGRLDALPDLLNGRSKGIRCVLGFQDIEGLVLAYNNDLYLAKEILNRCMTVSWLKINSPDTSKWASERTGEMERFEYLESQSKDGTTTGEHLAKRDALLPSQFQGLPFFENGVAAGLHMIKGLTGVFPSSVKYGFPEAGSADFDPRPDHQQTLEPWGKADEKWYAAGETDKGDDSEPDEPDLGSIGRIDF